MTADHPAAALIAHVLEMAETLGWPAAEIPPDFTVGPGRDAWAEWVAQVDRPPIATAIGVLVVRVQREQAA